MTCEMCDKTAFICRVRRGRATYYCADCMNVERDKGVMRGDMWFAVNPENV